MARFRVELPCVEELLLSLDVFFYVGYHRKVLFLVFRLGLSVFGYEVLLRGF